MIEIIPNMHPFVVHFIIALVVVSALLHLIVSLEIFSRQASALSAAANWNLWLGAGIGVLAVIAGFFAYNTVDHDTPSHLAMTDHKNWALPTLAVCIVAAIVSFMNARKQKPIAWTVTALVVVAAALILVTGFKGGELVYRHGLGVMSLPKSDSHAHAPGQEHDHGSTGHHNSGNSNSGHDSLDTHEHGDSGHDSLEGGHDHGGAGHDSLESGGHDHQGAADESSKAHVHSDGKAHQH